VLKAAVWIVGLLGILRLPWVQTYLLVPFAGLQQRVGHTITGSTHGALVVDSSCTGSDALALCLGAILAFPVSWRERLKGCAVGLALITLLNTARIGTLSAVVGHPSQFNLLHIYIWPATIVTVAAGYVFFWMNAGMRASARQPLEGVSTRWLGCTTILKRRFFRSVVLFVGIYYAAAQWFLESTTLSTAARWSAGCAAFIMSMVGASATAAGNLLTTAHGTWVVTPECVATPLIPVYLAAVLYLPVSPWKRTFAILAMAPLFLFLATVRLLILALPPTLIPSHNTAIHAFYQILAGLILVAYVSYRFTGSDRSPKGPRAFSAIAFGLTAGVLFGFVDGYFLRPVLTSLEGHLLHPGHSYMDSQGALMILPSYQLGLLVALWLATGMRFEWPRTGIYFLGLGAFYPVTLVVLCELSSHLGFEPPIIGIRTLAIVVPVLLAGLAFSRKPHPPEPIPSTSPAGAL
jgi:exosortase/archaeosortase family protein